MNADSTSKCPQCGAPRTTSDPAGLCPNCLMALNLKTETVIDGQCASSLPPPPPETIAPHFPQLEVLACLGRGGMGVVYQARQKSLNRLVALKLLAPERTTDAAFADRFAREAQALARLNHPNIVTIHDYGQAGGFYFLLLEYIDGVNLRQLMNASRVEPREALAIVPQICDALQYAHDQGIVHRDIKPENILLDRRGRVKVADFGLAKMIGAERNSQGTRTEASAMSPSSTGSGAAGVASNLTDAGKVMGTPHYMSPEQVHAPGAVDHRADIYALGVVFYQMLTGELPGRQLEPPSRKVRLDVRLDEIVLRALEQKPELRYQQVSLLKSGIESIADTNPAATPGGEDSIVPASSWPWPWRRWIAIAVAIPIVLLSVRFGIQTWRVSTGNLPLERLKRSPHLLLKLPTERLIEIALADLEQPSPLNELRRRELSPLDVTRFMAGVTAVVRRLHPDGIQGHQPWLDGFVSDLDKRGLLSEGDLLPYLDAIYGRVRGPRSIRMREGDLVLNVQPELRAAHTSGRLGLTLMNDLQVATVDGLPVNVSRYSAAWGGYEFHLGLSLPHLMPGDHPVRLEILSALVATADVAGLSRDARSVEWPPARKRWTRPYEFNLIVYPVGVPMVELTTDPALDPLTAGSLSVDRVILRSRNNGARATFHLEVNPTNRPPVHLSFEVRLRLAGQTIPCGHLSVVVGASGRITTSSNDRQVDLLQVNVGIREAEIILSPDPRPVERNAEVDRIWGKEIVFRQVPLRRLDLNEPSP